MPYTINRRDFLKGATAAGIAAAMMPYLKGCSSSGSAATFEKRTYFFDLSGLDARDEHWIIAPGSGDYRLDIVTPEVLAAAARENPFLAGLSTDFVTHVAQQISMPAENVQICYIKSIPAGTRDGSWYTPMLFMHYPEVCYTEAARMLKESGDAGVGAGLAAFFRERYGFTLPGGAFGLAPSDQLRMADAFKAGEFETACAFSSNHPELLCGEPNSAKYIRSKHLESKTSVKDLADSIREQGPATTRGGWAKLVPFGDQESGIFKDDGGDIVYFFEYSDKTIGKAGLATRDALGSAKNDTQIGANASDSAGNPPAGKIWAISNGRTTKEAATLAAEPEGAYHYDLNDINNDHGLAIDVIEKGDDGNPWLKIKTNNWYNRYLGLYVRYLDSGGNPVPRSRLDSAIRNRFPSEYNSTDKSSVFYREYDNMLTALSPGFHLMGIPVRGSRDEFVIPVPVKQAASALILAGGLGIGSNDYPDTIYPGIILTASLNLGLPSILLAMGAATQFSAFLQSFKDPELVELVVNLVAAGIATYLTTPYSYKGFMKAAMTVGTYILKKGLLFIKLIALFTQSAVLKAIPLIGTALGLVFAADTLAGIIATTAEVLLSPLTYTRKASLTHDFAVKVLGDPKATREGLLPATADRYQLVVRFSNSSPVRTGLLQVNEQDRRNKFISYTFKHVPYGGGNAQVDVVFYTSRGCPVGKGSSGTFDNTIDSREFSITQLAIPLDSSSRYVHRSKTTVDSSNRHHWIETSSAPGFSDLKCGIGQGQLCELTGITVNTFQEAIGYSFRSYGEACSGGRGQVYQFANMPVPNADTQYTSANCGASGTVRIVYDPLGSPTENYYIDAGSGRFLVRQIRFRNDGSVEIDDQNSDRSWGQFNLASDLLIMHPSRRLFSINRATNRVEVLTLPDRARSDRSAPFALPYAGTGTRPGLINYPTAAAVTSSGVILLLEQENRRIQAFDPGMNPVRFFHNRQDYFLQLFDDGGVFLDLSVEQQGYMYVLTRTPDRTHRMYLYSPDSPNGSYLTRTVGVNAGRLAVDNFRTVYTMNYEVLNRSDGVTEPSLSQWIPDTNCA